MQAVAGTLPPGRVKWTANISKDTEDSHDREKQDNLVELVEIRATERRSERAASKETTKHIWHVLPDK